MTGSILPTDGLVAFVKRECPTCTLIEPQLRELARALPGFRAVSQDDPHFPAGVQIIDDRELDVSWLNNIESTPTLIRFTNGREAERVVGWDRHGWQQLTGLEHLGKDLPALRPG
jgi:thiol-disulfide isomerase/thioredoxin